MNRMIEKVVPLISPALRERFLLAFPSDEQQKTRIYFGGNIAEIESGALGYFFTVKQSDGKLLAGGAENSFEDALRRVVEHLQPPLRLPRGT